jgi:hypothetical protein
LCHGLVRTEYLRNALPAKRTFAAKISRPCCQARLQVWQQPRRGIGHEIGITSIGMNTRRLGIGAARHEHHGVVGQHPYLPRQSQQH